MSDPVLRRLFEGALTDEPVGPGTIDDDVRRGRALRARRMRRVGGGVGAGAALLVGAALVVPASPLSVDHDDADGARQVASAGGAILDPEVADDPLLRELWDAVEGSLPDDATVEHTVQRDGHGPGVWVDLERGGEEVTVRVSLEPGRPDLEPYRPCSALDRGRHTSPYSDMADVNDLRCEEDVDDAGRRHVSTASTSEAAGLTVVSTDDVAANIFWHSFEDSAEVLSAEEWHTIAAAAWSAGESEPALTELAGIDLVTAQAIWTDLEDVLEQRLGFGPLTPVEPTDPAAAPGADDSGVAAAIDETWQSGSIQARYETPDGTLVGLTLWQKDRRNDIFCDDQLGMCSDGRSTMMEEPVVEGAIYGPGNVGQLGHRSGLYLVVGTGELTDPDDPESSELAADVSAAHTAVLRLIPFLGSERYPIPAGV